MSSCKKFDDFENIEGTDAQAAFAIPLLDTRFAMKDLLENFDDNSFLVVDSEGLIHFMYSGDVLTRTSDDIFQAIKDALPPAFPVTDSVMALPLAAPEGIQIDQMVFKSGRIDYGLVSTNEDFLYVNINMPQLSKNGVPFERTHFVPRYNGIFPSLVQDSILLESYDLTPEQDSIYIKYEALDEDSNRVLLDNFLMAIEDLTFSYSEGYLGQQTYDSDKDTIEIDFFENWKRGEVFFQNPTISIMVENSFGIPTRSLVDVFNVITALGDTLPLQSPVLGMDGTGINFEYPTLNEVGQSKITDFNFTTENSNIDTVLGSSPIALIYDVDALTNPDSNTAIRGFVTDESAFTVNVSVDLPLYGKASGFGVTDTFEMDFLNQENVESVEFKIVTENELGIDIDLQAYFLDKNGTVIDSLLQKDQHPITAAPIDGNGEVIEVQKTTTLIPFDKTRFEQIKTAQQIVVDAAFSTSNQGQTPVKIFEDEGVNIRMGMKIRNE